MEALWLRSDLAYGYEVSDAGDMRRWAPNRNGSRVTGINLRHHLKNGYKRYAVHVDGSTKQIKACRLVIEAFVGPKPFKDAEVCHCDGDRSNDHFSNLRWDTRANNAADRILHGTTTRGERNRAAKLVETQVIEIKVALAAGEAHGPLARQYNVSPRTISAINVGSKWKHVAVRQDFNTRGS